jgi:PAS domain S-box-containing protein
MLGKTEVVTTTATKQLTHSRATGDRMFDRFGRLLHPRPGVRTRQITLITLLVAVVVTVITIADVTYITGQIIKRTLDQTSQLSQQIIYAVEQEATRGSTVDDSDDPYQTIASEHSRVRGLMESAIAAKGGPIVYLYLTNAAGEVVTAPPGRNPLAINKYMIDENPYDLELLEREGAYEQLARVFHGPAIYEYHKDLPGDAPIAGRLHIGVSATTIRQDLSSPIKTNLLIGLLAIIGGAIIAISSANLLLKPLEVISSSIERLGLGESQPITRERALPRDEVVSSVTARLRQLGERIAGDRTELEIMRGRLRQVISHVEERLLLINRDGRIILASPDAERLIGAGTSELAGVPIDENLGPKHPLVQIVDRAFRERRSIGRTILEVKRTNGSRQLIASVQYIEDAGDTVGALVSLRDFDSFQKLESQWDLSKKLADLGRITSGIAHEVKNPLNAMVIHLEILRSKLDTGAGDPAPQIEILDSEIKRLDRVVQTFLNFTRPVDPRLDPLDLNTMVSQVVALAATEAGDQGVSIATDLYPMPVVIKADADLLKQAVLNVIINGCQAMPDGGTLEVATVLDDNGAAHIVIRDHGIGISAEAKSRIFNLYYTTKKGGTGIGLAQAFRAVQLHNGKIDFDSEEGRGTTFDISLPVSPDSAAAGRDKGGPRDRLPG